MSSAKVADITDNTPNQELINCLERALGQARSGEVRTMVWIKGMSDDSWCNGWVLDNRNSRRRMIGEMALTHHDLMNNQCLADGETILSMVFDQD